jgi:hypothetical protein
MPSTESGDSDAEGSSGDGLNWVKLGLSLDAGPPGSLDQDRVTSPSVILDGDIYKMWYSGYDLTNWRVFYATSLNGYSWTKHGMVYDIGPPGSAEDRHLGFPSVILDDGVYKMWYTGESYSLLGWRIFHATSPDGITWTRQGMVMDLGFAGVYDSWGLAHVCVLKEMDGTYSMWYSGYDGSNYRILHATSNDGLSWISDGLALDIGPPGSLEDYGVLAPSVIFARDGTYQMYYSGGWAGDASKVRIFYASSPDGAGINWQRGGMVIDIGQPGDWDSVQAIGPRVVRESRFMYKMWYTAFNGVSRRVCFAMAGEMPSVEPTNLTTSVVNDRDIELNWTDPDLPFLDHYLIYKSPDHRSFDFSSWDHNTSGDVDPLATTWIDLDAAAPGSPPQLYYVVRAVYSYGGLSTTSNTAGKWTLSFDAGLASFSFPLKPFEEWNVSWYADQIPNLRYMAWLGPNDRWVVHESQHTEGVRDTIARFGTGYELHFDAESNFTLCGTPGSMIKFKEGLGESVSWAQSLSASHVIGEVTLRWNQLPGAAEYDVFKAEERVGLHNLTMLPAVTVHGSVTSWVDTGPFENSSSAYYMVVPVNSSGVRGSSTYSVGVERTPFDSGIHSMGLTLDPIEQTDLVSLCGDNSGIEGIAFVTSNVWKFHAWAMPQNSYNTVLEQSNGYQVSVRSHSQVELVEIGY